MSIPVHNTELNRHNTFRYLESRRIPTMNGNSKPVLPIYRQQHQIDPVAKKAERGRDSRDEASCHRKRLQRDKDSSRLIIETQF
tara:strand:- start:2469 stop:2720 length:252 start_codon:yes stop_codon:yes gene_type:complete